MQEYPLLKGEISHRICANPTSRLRRVGGIESPPTPPRGFAPGYRCESLWSTLCLSKVCNRPSNCCFFLFFLFVSFTVAATVGMCVWYWICSDVERNFGVQYAAVVRSCVRRYTTDHHWTVSVHCHRRLLRSTSRLHWQRKVSIRISKGKGKRGFV